MINCNDLMEAARRCAMTQSLTTLDRAGAAQLHNAVSAAVMEAVAPRWKECEEKRQAGRQACYLSAEYLMGRLVFNNLYCLGLLEEAGSALKALGADPALMEDIEDDAFGNGGLGRLAACFLDSAATHGIPLTGYGLRYRYGLFRQRFADGRQVEEPDDWSRWGDPWSVRREEEAVTVPLRGGAVLAVPYDMPVIGFGGRYIGTLRLWQCESLHETDFELFSRQKYAQACADKNRAEDITKYLYPNDTHPAGKRMRVKQQYVLASASVQDMLRQYESRHGRDYAGFARLFAVQLNDTHPVMAIPELIRLLEERGTEREAAFRIALDTFAYTNHTVMQEALEKWDLSLLREVCPEIVEIIRWIDARFRWEMDALSAPKGRDWRRIHPGHCIVEGKRVHMAQLAVYATHATNGVAEIHSGLLQTSLFPDWYAQYPERFQNKTNGITQRRWLGLCNPELTALLKEHLGGDGFLTDLYQLRELNRVLDGPEAGSLISAFREVKREKKRQLARAVGKATGITLNPDMVFVVQVKRLHEYKRQLMNALSILEIWRALKRGELKDFPPTAFVFGAKAASGYDRAKAVIHLINQIAALVNGDAETRELLQVVFVPNYNCSWAELIIPAADISEQISPAGTEASGTGNMKLMLNGAVTLGTFDGANIEIVQEAGEENNYVFGATVQELDAIRASYDPMEIYLEDPIVREAVDALADGSVPGTDAAVAELKDALLKGASWHKPDHYFVLYDFRSYLARKLQAIADCAEDPDGFAEKCLRNVAGAGKFSSDRTVAEYARDIWRVAPAAES